MSSPAKAGDPVLQRRVIDPLGRGALDALLSRDRTTRKPAEAIPIIFFATLMDFAGLKPSLGTRAKLFSRTSMRRRSRTRTDADEVTDDPSRHQINRRRLATISHSVHFSDPTIALDDVSSARWGGHIRDRTEADGNPHGEHSYQKLIKPLPSGGLASKRPGGILQEKIRAGKRRIQ